MKYIILIITAFLLTACSDKDSENAKDLISNSDFFLIYKYDSLSNDFLLFNIPSSDTIDYLKKILTFDGKFKKVKTISPNYRFDLIIKDSIKGDILIEQSTTPCLTIKSNEFEASRELDYGLGMYLGEIEQNVYSTKTSTDLSFRQVGNLSNKICGFSKKSDSSFYSNLFISQYLDVKNQKKHDLKTLINEFIIYWNVAKKDSKIKLSSANIGYPLEYEDVLKRHIEGFLNSAEWIDYVKHNGKKPNYELTKSIMLNCDVYKPLNDFIKSKGFEIVDLSLEKLGYIDLESLKKLGFDDNVVIPMPYMVWIKIEKNWR